MKMILRHWLRLVQNIALDASLSAKHKGTRLTCLELRGGEVLLSLGYSLNRRVTNAGLQNQSVLIQHQCSEHASTWLALLMVMEVLTVRISNDLFQPSCAMLVYSSMQSNYPSGHGDSREICAMYEEKLTSESKPWAAVQQVEVGVCPLDFKPATSVLIWSSVVATIWPPVAWTSA